MPTPHRYQRPPFEDAEAVWKNVLAEHGFSTKLLWILEENLCFENDPGSEAGVKLGFQTQFTAQPPDLAKVTYHYFAEMESRLVFYRLGSNNGHSVCMILCDDWFEPKHEKDGYLRKDEWLASFHPGGKGEIEEIAYSKRWQQRVVRGRPLTPMDFCMTLAALRELKAHGRLLDADERLGLKILRGMQARS